MKVLYTDLIDHIESKPKINEISDKLFQLGHENEVIDGKIIDIELTPNRGDCLSIIGILRELSVFYDVKFSYKTFEKEIDHLKIDFKNNALSKCPHISFLKIEIEEEISSYKNFLNNYFLDLDINKNNFFTDISNYLSYETGQPTHCYDAGMIKNQIALNVINKSHSFETLLGKTIELTDSNLVFSHDNQIINLAGIIGGKSTSCSKDTKEVIVECAYFAPDEILGKSVKYDIKSDAAYKFERNVDPVCHDFVLRRFIKIVEEHVKIKKLEIVHHNYETFEPKKIHTDVNIINNILGTSISESKYYNILKALNFKIDSDKVIVPSYRNDVTNNNDLAEEVARIIGYNNIENVTFTIKNSNPSIDKKSSKESYIKNFLIKMGFFEVINNPFSEHFNEESIQVDNPLDSGRSFLRQDLKQSLINNLLFNERRQKDSIKLFEISDIYKSSNGLNKRTMLGLIASGRIGKNYRDFAKKVDKKYIENTLSTLISFKNINIIEIPRDSLDTKSKNKIFYLELDIDTIDNIEPDIRPIFKKFNEFRKYQRISEYPSSTRDLSYSTVDHDALQNLQDMMLNYRHENLKEIFIFDFFVNQNTDQIKIGYRFVFQSLYGTMTENDIQTIMDDIISKSLKIKLINIPGINN